MTSTRRRLALIAGATLLAGGAGSGIAMASSPAAALATAPAATVSAATPTPSGGENCNGPDRDNIQQGDQNAPDTGKCAQEQERAGEAPENGVEDGPGGHADANSSVDHQFTGVE